jgi:hypothetical protein
VPIHVGDPTALAQVLPKARHLKATSSMGGIIALPSGQFRVQQAVSGFGLRGHGRPCASAITTTSALRFAVQRIIPSILAAPAFYVV